MDALTAFNIQIKTVSNILSQSGMIGQLSENLAYMDYNLHTKDVELYVGPALMHRLPSTKVNFI